MGPSLGKLFANPGAIRVQSGRNLHGLDEDWTGTGRGLDVDWTRIGRGLDADSTRIGRGLDVDWTRIGRGLEGLYPECTQNAKETIINCKAKVPWSSDLKNSKLFKTNYLHSH